MQCRRSTSIFCSSTSSRATKIRLCVEQLERRVALSQMGLLGDNVLAHDPGGEAEFHAVIVAGSPNGSPADSPANRVDANTTTSPFAGVGSLRIATRRATYICSGTAIDATHVVTAGHCLDINNDGKSNNKDGIRSVTFNLNAGGNLTSQIPAASWSLHPDFTGFNRPSINDDIAVITLAAPVPDGVPTYALSTTAPVAGQTHLYMVGYGQSGDGVSGYYVNASFTVKRRGENMIDAFYGQDDVGRPAANEVFRYDFDGPSGNGTFGGPTLGNDKETTLGGGDSGGPSFVLVGGSYQLAGVNTFTQGFTAPRFGSLGGGIVVAAYASWIQSFLSGASGASVFAGNATGSPMNVRQAGELAVTDLPAAFEFSAASAGAWHQALIAPEIGQRLDIAVAFAPEQGRADEQSQTVSASDALVAEHSARGLEASDDFAAAMSIAEVNQFFRLFGQ